MNVRGMRIRLAALALSCLPLYPIGAVGSNVQAPPAGDERRAADAAPRSLEPDTVAALLRWIGDNTRYAVDTVPPPAVLLLSPAALTREAFAEAPASAPPDGVDERLRGLYAPGDGAHGTVYVLGCRDADARAAALEPCTGDPRFLERVLHELVHHAQHVSGIDVRAPCARAVEREAYRLGGRFLKARHADDPLPNRAFWAALEGRC